MKVMKKYRDKKQLHEDVEGITKSGFQVSSGEFEHIAEETIRLLKEEKNQQEE